jgi:hypothetical protein
MALIDKIEPLPCSTNGKMLHDAEIKGYGARSISEIVGFNISALKRC